MSQNLVQMPGFDILMFGDENVGKSAIINKFCPGDVETDLENQRLRLQNNNEWCKIIKNKDKNIRVCLWEYQSWTMNGLLNLFLGKPFTIILCYDVTSRKSFRNLSLWVSKLDERFIKDFFGILVGNKSDLPRNKGVSYNEGKRLAEKLGLFFIEASAKYSKNIDEIFNILIRIASYNLDR